MYHRLPTLWAQLPGGREQGEPVGRLIRRFRILCPASLPAALFEEFGTLPACRPSILPPRPIRHCLTILHCTMCRIALRLDDALDPFDVRMRYGSQVHLHCRGPRPNSHIITIPK